MISVADVVQPTQDTPPQPPPLQRPHATGSDTVTTGNTTTTTTASSKTCSKSSAASTPAYSSITSTSSISTSSHTSDAGSGNAMVVAATRTRAAGRRYKSVPHSESDTASVALEEIQAELMQVLRLQQQRVEAAELKLGHMLVHQQQHQRIEAVREVAGPVVPRLTGPDCCTLADVKEEDEEDEVHEPPRSQHTSQHLQRKTGEAAEQTSYGAMHNMQPQAAAEGNTSGELTERPGSPLFHSRRHARRVGHEADGHCVLSSTRPASDHERTCSSPVYNQEEKEEGGGGSPEYERFLAQLKDQQRQHHEVLRRQRALRAAMHDDHTDITAAQPETHNHNVTAGGAYNEAAGYEGDDAADGNAQVMQGLRFVRLYSHDKVCRSPPLALMHHVVGTPSSVENGHENNNNNNYNPTAYCVSGNATSAEDTRQPDSFHDMPWQSSDPVMRITPLRPSGMPAAGTPRLAPPPQLLVTSTRKATREAKNECTQEENNKAAAMMSYNTTTTTTADTSAHATHEEEEEEREGIDGVPWTGRLKLSPVEPFADVLLSDNARHQRRDRHTTQKEEDTSVQPGKQHTAADHAIRIDDEQAHAMNEVYVQGKGDSAGHRNAGRTKGPSSSLIPERGTVTPRSARPGVSTAHQHIQQQRNTAGVDRKGAALAAAAAAAPTGLLVPVRHNAKPISTAALRRAVEALWQERGMSRHKRPAHLTHAPRIATTTTTATTTITPSPAAYNKSPAKARIAQEGPLHTTMSPHPPRPNTTSRSKLPAKDAAVHDPGTHLISYLPHTAAAAVSSAAALPVARKEKNMHTGATCYHFADSLVGAALTDVFPDLRRRQRVMQRELQGNYHLYNSNTSSPAHAAAIHIQATESNGNAGLRKEQRRASQRTCDEYYYYDRGFRPTCGR